MKKLALFLTLVLVLVSFTSCGDSNETPESTAPETTEVTETTPENVVISVNKELVADETAFLTEISEIDGITSTANENFYVLTMSQNSYKELLTVKSKEVIDEYEGIVAQGKYIEDIRYDSSFRNINVLVNRQEFDAVDASAQQLQLITIGAKAMSYQMFLPEGQKTAVSIVYSDTEEVAFTLSLPIKM